MSKRLIDLDPKFFTRGDTDQRVGLTFKCPGCDDPHHRVAVAVDPPFDPGPTPGHAWQRKGNAFSDLTLTPSVRNWRRNDDGTTIECWHGYITNGQAVP